jgi:Putative peptidoglycan binding domain
LREALAAADHDFVLTVPASKLKYLREKVLAAKRRSLGRKMRRGRRYLPMLAASFFAATAAGILLNALLWQKTRHPAPLFSRAAPATAAKRPATSEAIAAPALRRPALAATSGEVPVKPAETPDTEKSPAIPGAGPPHKAGTNAAPPRPHDQISQLLKATQMLPARPPATASITVPSRSVLATQHALIKLGFVLKADGVLGAATRHAIERYELDRGLPAHGDLTPELMRKLSTETGISIN